MANTADENGKPIKLVSATDATGTLVPANQVCVSVDADGVVSIAIPEDDVELHPRAVALVAAAMKLDDETTVAALMGTLRG
ncbi:MAG: hypothetical protein AB8B88_06925 [Devosiaceae bacterium]